MQMLSGNRCNTSEQEEREKTGTAYITASLLFTLHILSQGRIHCQYSLLLPAPEDCPLIWAKVLRGGSSFTTMDASGGLCHCWQKLNHSMAEQRERT